MELYIVTVGLPGVLFDKEITYYNVVSVGLENEMLVIFDKYNVTICYPLTSIKYYEFKRQ